MNNDIASLLTDKSLITGALFLGGLIFCIFITIWIVIDARHKAALARDREESRREIAAYVAEGSMTADEAERILSAGGSIGHRILNEIGGLRKASDSRPARAAAYPAAQPAASPLNSQSANPQAT
jgi:hypothetical protein